MTFRDLYFRSLCLVLCCALYANNIAYAQPNDALLAGAAQTPAQKTAPKVVAQWVTPAPKTLSELLPTVSVRSEWEEPSISRILQQSSPSFTKNTVIEHRYYVDNIFTIEESDNPLALRRSRQFSPQTRLSSSAPSRSAWTDIKELFATQDKTIHSNNTPAWLLFILLGSLGFLAMMMTLFRQDIFKIFSAFINSTTAGQLYRAQTNDLFTPVGLSSFTLFSLSLSSFLFLAVGHLSPNEIPTWNTFGSYLATVLGVVSLYGLKHLQVTLIGMVFPFQQEMSYYNFLISNHNKILGIILLPLIFALAYVPESLQVGITYLGIGILAGMYLYRSFRVMAMSSDWILFNKFHFLVYICTAEIAPAIVLIKLLSIL